MIPNNVTLKRVDRPFSGGEIISISAGFEWPSRLEPYARFQRTLDRIKKNIECLKLQEQVFVALNKLNLSRVDSLKSGCGDDSLFVLYFKDYDSAVDLFNQIVHIPNVVVRVRVFPVEKLEHATAKMNHKFRSSLFLWKYKYKLTFGHLTDDERRTIGEMVESPHSFSGSQWSYGSKRFNRYTFYSNSLDDIAIVSMLHQPTSEIWVANLV